MREGYVINDKGLTERLAKIGLKPEGKYIHRRSKNVYYMGGYDHIDDVISMAQDSGKRGGVGRIFIKPESLLRNWKPYDYN